jgi:adenosylhomocysteine nucleosidase
MQSEAARLAAVLNSSTKNEDLIACAGGHPGRAYAEADKLISRGATRLISFGICGALDSKIRPGDIVMPTYVKNPQNDSFTVDVDWRDRLLNKYAANLNIHTKTLFTSETAIATISEKESLRKHTNASIVDMESSGLAASATSKKISFIVIRAAADPAERPLPKSALVGMDTNGQARPFAVLSQLFFRPWELPGLIRLGKDNAKALEALSRVALIGF